MSLHKLKLPCQLIDNRFGFDRVDQLFFRHESNIPRPIASVYSETLVFLTLIKT